MPETTPPTYISEGVTLEEYLALEDKLAECAYEGMSPRETTDALLAEGWRPPAQVITDPSAADELPDGAVILAGEVVAQRMSGVGGVLGRWWQVLDGDAVDTADELMHLSDADRITVLHVPTQEAGQ